MAKTKIIQLTREEMIVFIKKHNLFYLGVNFSGHTTLQIIEIYEQTLSQIRQN